MSVENIQYPTKILVCQLDTQQWVNGGLTWTLTVANPIEERDPTNPEEPSDYVSLFTIRIHAFFSDAHFFTRVPLPKFVDEISFIFLLLSQHSKRDHRIK